MTEKIYQVVEYKQWAFINSINKFLPKGLTFDFRIGGGVPIPVRTYDLDEARKILKTREDQRRLFGKKDNEAYCVIDIVTIKSDL